MTRKISSFIFIGLIFTLIIWMLDKHSVIAVQFRGDRSNFSIPEAMFVVLLCVAIIDFINRLFRKLIFKQAKEAYKTAVLNSRSDESAAIEALAGRISERLVLERQDFDNALLLVLKIMTAITAGDMHEARATIKELKKIIGNDPILDLLQMKIYKGEKDFAKMGKLSAKLIKNEDVQMVGLKAAVEVQMQKKEFNEALTTANKAFELRQDLYWVIESAFELRARNNDWEGAMQVFDAGVKKKIIPVAKQRRLKSVVLFELAKQLKAKGDETNFFKFCTQAFESDQTLVAAAIELAQYYVANDNQYRQAAKILTTAWKKNPTDTVAYAYLALFPNESYKEKIARMEEFSLYNSKRPSLNNRILAELCVEVGLWQKAKGEIEVFLINNPCTQTICKLIASFEKLYNKDNATSQKWLDKFDTCARDSEWVCSSCNAASEEWYAVCPVCGAFGESRWHLYTETPEVESENTIDNETDSNEDDEE